MKTLALTALISLTFAAQAHAAPQTLDLTAGIAGGDSLALDASSLYMTTSAGVDDDFNDVDNDGFDDDGFDFNFSGMAPLMAGGDLEAVAGHPVGEYDIGGFDGSSSMATEGSVYVLKNVSVAAGDTLSFDWTFYTNEPETGALADAAYFSVLGNITALLANAADGLTGDAGLSGFRAATGGVFSHTFLSNNVFDLVFAVVDTDDYVTSSALAINNVTITPVPDPKDWILMLAGLGMVGLMIGRNKRRLM